MTQIVEFMLDSARFSPACCRCNAASFVNCRHTEKVVKALVGHATVYDRISLDIPLCGKCRHRSHIWFGVAILSFAGLFAGTYLKDAEGWFDLMAMACIFCIVMGARTRPVKILSYDGQRNSIRLQLHSDAYAARLVVENPGSVLPPPVLNAPRKVLGFFLRPGVLLVLVPLLVWLFLALTGPETKP
jgi:hypothetical protein